MFSGGQLSLGVWLNLGAGGRRGNIGGPRGADPCGRAAMRSSRWQACRRAGVIAGTRAVAACRGDFGNTRGLVLGTSLHL